MNFSLREPLLSDSPELFRMLSNPNVKTYSRIRPETQDQMFQMIDALGKLEDAIPRVIVDGDTILGMIVLWDYCPFRKDGCLATWLGQEHWGKGYNNLAKDFFLSELYANYHVDTVYMTVRSYNQRSIAALKKFDYIVEADEEFAAHIKTLPLQHTTIENNHVILVVDKELFLLSKTQSVSV